jgi:hypothetical protein
LKVVVVVCGPLPMLTVVEANPYTAASARLANTSVIADADVVVSVIVKGDNEGLVSSAMLKTAVAVIPSGVGPGAVAPVISAARYPATVSVFAGYGAVSDDTPKP